MYVFEYGWPVAEVSVVHAADGTGAAVPGLLVTGNATDEGVGVANGAWGAPVHAARLTRLMSRIDITTAYFTDIVPR